MHGLPEFAITKITALEMFLYRTIHKTLPHVWTDRFTVNCNEYDESIGFVYEQRAEGGGFHKMHRTEKNRWVPEEVQFID